MDRLCGRRRSQIVRGYRPASCPVCVRVCAEGHVCRAVYCSRDFIQNTHMHARTHAHTHTHHAHTHARTHARTHAHTHTHTHTAPKSDTACTHACEHWKPTYHHGNDKILKSTRVHRAVVEVLKAVQLVEGQICVQCLLGFVMFTYSNCASIL